MKSYQTLALIGGILGILIVFSVFILLSFANSLVQSFDGVAKNDDQFFAQMAISFLLYMITIIIPFVLKNSKIVGYILLILGISTLISAGYYGIVGFVILIAGGFIAIRYKESPKTSSSELSSVDILASRYAKGEITKEQFDEMKKRLDGLRE